MLAKRIVATAPIGAIAINILERAARVETARAPDEASILGMLEGSIGLVARGMEARVTARIIDAGRELRVIGRPGAGYDTVDIAAATARRIPVVFAPVGGFAVAEGALAILLALIKRIPECDAMGKRGEWQRRYDVETGDMAEGTLGIIGLGRIGGHLARLAQPFGMTVLGYDPFLSVSAEALPGVERVDLPELLRRSDFISLHVPLTDQTYRLIDREQIATIKPGAILINTARGAIIESLDLLADALDSGQLGGVGLDVFPVEPPDPCHRLFRHPRFLCAPHLLGVSRLAMARIHRSMATDMLAVLEGRKPTHCVNPEVFER